MNPLSRSLTFHGLWWISFVILCLVLKPRLPDFFLLNYCLFSEASDYPMFAIQFVSQSLTIIIWYSTFLVMTSKYSPLTIPPYLCSPKQHDRKNGKKASVPNSAWDTLWHFSIHTVNVLHLTLARICPQLLTTNSKIVCICKPSNIFLQLQRPYHIPQTGEQPFKLSR